jgi:aminopeptidase N
MLAVLLWPGLSATASPQVPTGRLPDTVKPEEYRLELTVDPARPAFSGHTEIDARLTRPASAIFVHGLNLRVSQAQVVVGERTLVATYTQVDPSGVVRLDLPRQLPAGPLTLRFDYTADFRDSAEGLFRTKVAGAWYAWTQMEAIDARRMFPGFDEPGFKTPFTVTVTAPAETRVFANAPETGTSPGGGGVVHRFARSKPLPTYLVAIAVGAFDVVETEVPPDALRREALPFRVIATRGQRPRMQIAATEGPRILSLLEAYLGLPYPYEKLDLVASPTQGGAMENAGLILFEDPLILLGEGARIGQLRGFAVDTAHEMSHQWFGDLVTPTWWTDIWLNESFAEWLGNKIANQWRPDLDVPVVQLSEALSAMDTDALGRGRPIHQEITESRQISSAFDDITYLKGAQVLSMFESFMGPEKFREGAQRHLQRHPYQSATADDFFRSLAEAAGDPRIVPALRTFIDQTGVPLISVSESPAGITLTQSRYHPLGVLPGAEQWSVPVCLSRGANRSCTLLETVSATIPPVPGEGPLVPNAGGAGYYRFRLDDAGWRRLLAATDRLPAREAMAVGDSLWSDFAAGTGSFAHVIAGARALATQPQALAATQLAQPLAALARTALAPTELAGYRRLMRQIYGPRLTAMGLELARGAYGSEPSGTQSLRQALVPLVALEARDPGVRAKLADAAVASVEGRSDALDDAFRRIALEVAVQDRGRPFMTQLRDVMQRSGDPLFREDAAAGLGAADTPDLAATALELAYSPGMRSSETLRIVAYLTREPGARATASAYINEHFDRVLQTVPGFERPRLVGWLFGEECSETAAAKADAWAHAHRQALQGGELELAQTKERIGVCASLRRAKGAEIAALLNAPNT